MIKVEVHKPYKPWYKKWWGIILIIFLALIFIQAFADTMGYFTNAPTNTQNLNNPSANADPYAGLAHDNNLVILNHNWSQGDFGMIEVVGTAQNIAGRKLRYAEIDVKFYDKEGAVIGTFLANTNNLGAGEKWKFKVPYVGMDTENLGKYEISIGTVW